MTRSRNCCTQSCLFISLLLLMFHLQANASPVWTDASLPNSQQFEITSRHTGNQYLIYVGLPHAPAPREGYPVLWMLDGAASFPILQFARPRPDDAQQGSRRETPVAARPAGLIVAIAHASGRPFDVDARALDYTLRPDADTGDRLSPAFGNAASFRRFLVEELRPAIAERYPLDNRRHTLFGFSYGGLFTLDTLMNEPQYFQRYWAASPSLWFSDAQLMRRLTGNAEIRTSAGVEKVVLSVGQEEQYPRIPVSAERQAHLNRRALVDHVQTAGQLLSEANPAIITKTITASDHDHFDMLMHGARRVINFAFAP